MQKSYPVLEVTDKTTKAEVFQAVVEHLRKQGKQSKEDSSCVNRTFDGMACAVACLFTDEEAANADGMSWVAMTEMDALDKRPEHLKPFSDLLVRLQQIHDKAPTRYVLNGILAKLAEELDTPFTKFEQWNGY